MKVNSTQINKLTEDFIECSKLLIALGDETRQHLIMEMMKIGDCSGVRVGEITKKSNLSRPAVSHHLKIMKEAGIVRMRKEGTKNYYYFDPNMDSFRLLVETLQYTMQIAKSLPDRSGDDE